MFLLRSAFWLTVAFMVMAPKDADFGSAAADLAGRAMAVGQQVVVTQVLSDNCVTLKCGEIIEATSTDMIRAKADALEAEAVASDPQIAATTTSTPSVDSTMQETSTMPVPFPRPRPAWMG